MRSACAAVALLSRKAILLGQDLADANGPAQTPLVNGSTASVTDERSVRFKKLLANLPGDHKRIWLFPAQPAQGHYWLPLTLRPRHIFVARVGSGNFIPCLAEAPRRWAPWRRLRRCTPPDFFVRAPFERTRRYSRPKPSPALKILTTVLKDADFFREHSPWDVPPTPGIEYH
jgi:hypothetical protein